jgi:uncharacterized damage-inducible protein DinB
MAWANARALAHLRRLDDRALAAGVPGNEWRVGMIAEHLVGAAEFYAWRLGAGPDLPGAEPPTRAAALEGLAARCAEADARIRLAAAEPEAIVESVVEGRTVRRARSTILGQAIHHATEHRAQLAEALVANGLPALDLDALDLWAYGDAEGLGA